MNMKSWFLVGVAAALSLSAVAEPAKDDPRAALKAARAAFEKANGAFLAGAKVKDAAVAPSASRLDAPKATGSWKAVLPYAEDARVRFLDVTLQDGAFVAGTLKTLGRPAEKLDAPRFAALREEFPIVAASPADEAVQAAWLYPPRKVSASVRAKDTDFPGAAAISRHLGALGGATKRLGLSTEELGYRVTFRDAQGKTLDLGVVKADLDAERIYPILRDGYEAAYPAEKGAFSKARATRYWRKGEVAYRGE